MVESNNGFVDQKVDNDNNLNIVQMITWSIEPTKELVRKELLVFQRY
jgi:hypothetical protein